jgi:hypothetical protein
MTDSGIQDRLEYLRSQIKAERISYGEIAELQDMVEHIHPSDVVLLEWAGVPESDARDAWAALKAGASVRDAWAPYLAGDRGAKE